MSVEQRRYDMLVTGYNASASSFTQRWGVHLSGLPTSVPLSSEMTSW